MICSLERKSKSVNVDFFLNAFRRRFQEHHVTNSSQSYIPVNTLSGTTFLETNILLTCHSRRHLNELMKCSFICRQYVVERIVSCWKRATEIRKQAALHASCQMKICKELSLRRDLSGPLLRQLLSRLGQELYSNPLRRQWDAHQIGLYPHQSKPMTLLIVQLQLSIWQLPSLMGPLERLLVWIFDSEHNGCFAEFPWSTTKLIE